MKIWVIVILIILLVLFLTWFYYSKSYEEEVYIKSDVDQRVYLIRRGNNKSQQFLKESANTLAHINLRIEKLIEHLEKNYSNDPSKNYFILKLKQNYHPYMISEAAVDPKYTTFTVDKQDINICLRTRDRYEHIYDINLLMYVVLHELAHLCNYTRNGHPIIGHGDEFKYIFAFLVQESMKIGIYNYENYANAPKEYCNIIINSSIL
jgi:hypothetical protein